jgi:hypothetical protein
LLLYFDSNNLSRKLTIIAIPKGNVLGSSELIGQEEVFIYVIRNWADCKVDITKIDQSTVQRDFLYSTSLDTLEIDLLTAFNVSASDENFMFGLYVPSFTIIGLTADNGIISTTLTSGFASPFNVSIKNSALIIGTYIPFNPTVAYKLAISVQIIQGDSVSNLTTGDISQCSFIKIFNIQVYQANSIIPVNHSYINLDGKAIWYLVYSRFNLSYTNTIQLTDNSIYGSGSKIYSFTNSPTTTSKTLTIFSSSTLTLTFSPSSFSNNVLTITYTFIDNTTVDSVTLNSPNPIQSELINIKIYEFNLQRTYDLYIRVIYSPKQKALIIGPSDKDLIYYSNKPWKYDLSFSYISPSSVDGDYSPVFNIIRQPASCPDFIWNGTVISLPMNLTTDFTQCLYTYTLTIYGQMVSTRSFKITSEIGQLPASVSNILIYIQSNSVNNNCYDLISIFPSLSFQDYSISISSNFITNPFYRNNLNTGQICMDTKSLPTIYNYAPSVFWDNSFMNHFFLTRFAINISLKGLYSNEEVNFPLTIIDIQKPLFMINNNARTYYLPRNFNSPFTVSGLIISCLPVYINNLPLSIDISLDNMMSTGTCNTISLSSYLSSSIPNSSMLTSFRYSLIDRVIYDFSLILNDCIGVPASADTAVLSFKFKVTYQNGLITSSDSQSIKFKYVDAPMFKNCSNDQAYFDNNLFVYGSRVYYTFGLYPSSNSALQLTFNYADSYGIRISTNPFNMQWSDTLLGEIFINLPATCPYTIANKICTLSTHTITVYSIPTGISSSCSVNIQITDSILFTNDVSSLQTQSFLCEIGTTFSFDFSKLLSHSNETNLSVTYQLELNIGYTAFDKTKLVLDSHTGILSWPCVDIIQDTDSITYPTETPDISIIAYTNTKNIPLYLLTFNIKPYRRPIVVFDTNICKDNAGFFLPNKDYKCQIIIKKCRLDINGQCLLNINYRKDIQLVITVNTPNSSFLYTVDEKSGYLIFRYNSPNTSSNLISIGLTIIAKEIIAQIGSSVSISSDPISFNLSFKQIGIPNVLFNDGSNKVVSTYQYSDVGLNGNTNISYINVYANIGEIITIDIFGPLHSSLSGKNYFLLDPFDNFSYFEVINKPADMFIVQNDQSYIQLNYKSNSYSDIDIKVCLKDAMGIPSQIFFRLKTLYTLSFTVPTSLDTQLNVPFFTTIIPDIQTYTNTQEIRLIDYNLVLTKQEICITLTNCKQSQLTYMINPLTAGFYFYPDAKKSPGNFYLFTFTTSYSYKQQNTTNNEITLRVDINTKNPYTNIDSPIFFNCDWGSEGFTKIYADPILIDASSFIQVENYTFTDFFDICVSHNQGLTGVLEFDLNNFPNKFNNFNGTQTLKLTKVNDNDFLQYKVSWNIKLTFFSTGLIRLNYIVNGSVISSIHFIIYDTMPNIYLDFNSDKSNTDINTINHVNNDTTVYTYTPYIYSYFLSKSKMLFGYQVMLNQNYATLNFNNCLIPHYSPTVTNNVSDYNNPIQASDYLWIPEPLVTDQLCASSLFKYKVFNFIFYSQYQAYIVNSTIWNNIKINIYTSTAFTMYEKSSVNIQLVPTNLFPVYILSSNEGYIHVGQDTLAFEEKPDYLNSSYTFTLTVTKPYDQLKNQGFTLTNIQVFHDNLHNTASYTDIPTTDAMLTYTSSTSTDNIYTYVDCIWFPRLDYVVSGNNTIRYSQNFLFTFNDNGVTRTTVVSLCVGSRCRYAPKNIILDVSSACSSPVVNTFNGNMFFNSCKRNALVNINTYLNIDKSAIIKLGGFNIEYTIDSVTNYISFNLPDVSSSGCLPLLIYNNCSYTYGLSAPYCQLGNAIQHFFTMSNNNVIDIFTITPYLINVSKDNDYIMSINGNNLSHDHRCFLERDDGTVKSSLELLYQQSNDTIGGCYLKIDNTTRGSYLTDSTTVGVKYCIYLQYKQFTDNGLMNLTNPSCIDAKTKCVPIVFSDFNSTYSVSFTAGNETDGHSVGGYLFEITVSGVQISPSYSKFSILSSSLVIQMDNTFIFSNNDVIPRIIDIVNQTSSEIKFSFIVPPMQINKNKSIFKVSINDGFDYFDIALSHNYFIPQSNTYLKTNISLDCPPGSFCPSNNFVYNPIPCYPGTYATSTINDKCAACPAGMMCPLEGMTEPEKCYPGFICNAAGIIFPRILCPGGFVCNQGTSTGMAELFSNLPIDNECPYGYYCEEGTSSRNPIIYVEKIFGNDSYWLTAYPKVDITNEIIVKTYSSAYYYTHNGTDLLTLWLRSHTPIPCLQAYDCTNASRITGRGKCLISFFCPLLSQRSAILAEINKFNPGYTCGNNICPCPEGYYCPINGLKVPYKCYRGAYNTKQKQTSCQDCPAGFYCPNDATYSVSQLMLCPKGSYCLEGSYEPSSCPVNTYNDKLGQVKCIPCMVGFECLYLGTITPTPCTAGYVCSFLNGIYQRKLCPINKYCPFGIGSETVLIIYNYRMLYHVYLDTIALWALTYQHPVNLEHSQKEIQINVLIALLDFIVLLLK